MSFDDDNREMRKMKVTVESNTNLMEELKTENQMIREIVRGSISSMRDLKKGMELQITEIRNRHQIEIDQLNQNNAVLEEKCKGIPKMEDEIRILKSKVKNLEEYVSNLELEKERKRLSQIEKESNELKRLLDHRYLSKILTKGQFEALQKECGFNGLEWERIYRGSENGFKSSDFHNRCDGIKGTLVIIHTTNGNVFGGYNPLTWNLKNGYANSTGSWLFGYRSKRFLVKFPYNGNGYGIMCSASYGPTFGGNHDLHVSSNCNTSSSSYTMLGVGGSSSYPHNGNGQYFLNGGSQAFQVLDYEVFKKK